MRLRYTLDERLIERRQAGRKGYSGLARAAACVIFFERTLASGQAFHVVRAPLSQAGYHSLTSLRMKDSAKKAPQNPDEQPPRRTTQNQPATAADPNAAFPGTGDEHRPGENLYTLPEMQEPQPRNPSTPQDTPAAPATAETSMLDRETHGQLLDEPAADGKSGISDSVINPVIAQSSRLEDNNRGE